MAEGSGELMFEVLKRIQADMAVVKSDLASIKTTVADHTRLLVRMREDDLRLEGMQSETQLRLDRIEARLNLSDA